MASTIANNAPLIIQGIYVRLVQDNAFGRSVAESRRHRLERIARHQEKRRQQENSQYEDRVKKQDIRNGEEATVIPEAANSSVLSRWESSGEGTASENTLYRPQRKPSLTHAPHNQVPAALELSLKPPQMPKRQVSIDDVPASVLARMNKQGTMLRSDRQGRSLSPAPQRPTGRTPLMAPTFMSASTA